MPYVVEKINDLDRIIYCGNDLNKNLTSLDIPCQRHLEIGRLNHDAVEEGDPGLHIDHNKNLSENQDNYDDDSDSIETFFFVKQVRMRKLFKTL